MPEYEQDLLEDLVKTNVFDPVLIRRMVRYLKPYWHRAALGFGLMLMSTLLTLAPAIIVAAMVDVVFVPAATTTAIPVGDGPAAAVSAKGGLYDFPGMRETIHALVPEGGDLATLLWVFAAVFLLVKVFQFLVDWGNGYLLASVAQSVLFDIRMQVFRHIQTRSIAYFHRHPVGRFVTRVTNDVGSLDEFFSQALVMVLKDIVMLFGVATLLLVFNTELALIVMMTIPPVIVATLVFRRYSRPAFRKFRATVSTLNAQMAESANGIRVIQLFGRAAKNQQRYDGTGREFRQHFLTFRHAHAVFRPVYMSFQAIALGFVIWFGGAWVLDEPLGTGGFTVGMLTLFILLADMFFQPIRDLTDRVDHIQAAFTGAERIFTVLDVKERIPERPDAVKAPRFRGEVEFENVRFSYLPGEEVLKGVSFNVQPGQMVALVGHTGAGKSTIINLISRFYDIDSGHILVDGRDVREYTLHSLRRNIAVVHQDVFLFAGSIRDNISLADPAISEEQVIEAAKAVGAHDFIMRFPEGYNHILQEAGKTFSAGERQLLSFARALAHNPAILVLDEATSSIDTRSEQQIQRAMRVLMKGRTSIVIAHRLSTIQRADLIIVMHKGQIAERGTHGQLLGEGRIYRTLYDLQVNGAVRERV